MLDSNIEAHEDDEVRVFKIGRAKDLTARVKQFDTAYAFKPSITYTFYASDYVKTERELHSLFAGQRLNGEWFRLSYEDLEFIANYAGNMGYIETVDGKLIKDFLFSEIEQYNLYECIEFLDSTPRFAKKVKYFPLSAKPPVGGDWFQLEESGAFDDPTDIEAENLIREKYQRECEIAQMEGNYA